MEPKVQKKRISDWRQQVIFLSGFGGILPIRDKNKSIQRCPVDGNLQRPWIFGVKRYKINIRESNLQR